MDEIDFHTFFSLEIIIKKNIGTFLKVNEIPDFKTLQFLIVVNYLRITRGHCYQYDVAYVTRSAKDVQNERRTSIMLTRLKKLGLATYTRTTPGDVTIRNYELSNKGHSVLDNYRSLFFRTENELTYELKKERDRKKKSK